MRAMLSDHISMRKNGCLHRRREPLLPCCLLGTMYLNPVWPSSSFVPCLTCTPCPVCRYLETGLSRSYRPRSPSCVIPHSQSSGRRQTTIQASLKHSSRLLLDTELGHYNKPYILHKYAKSATAAPFSQWVSLAPGGSRHGHSSSHCCCPSWPLCCP